MTDPTYVPRWATRSEFHPVRGLRYHVHRWPARMASSQPPLVMVHGWMDVGASFQFVADALADLGLDDRDLLAPDWRGFGRSESPATDCYWFPDYLGDLDALLDRVAPDGPVDLLGHSMGGNVVMSYAGARPSRIRRLINLEGFGLPRMKPTLAPRRLVQWLDELKTPQRLREYASLAEVAERLRKNNPRLTPDKAAWLAPHWAERRDDGLWHILGDPAHKRANPVLYQVEEVLETWKLITAPLLWAEGVHTDIAKWWGSRYTREEFLERLSVVRQVEHHRLADCGHMLHHDQPEVVADLVAHFLRT